MRNLMAKDVEFVSGGDKQVFDDGSSITTDANGNITLVIDSDGDPYYGSNYCGVIGDTIGDTLGPSLVATLCPSSGPFAVSCATTFSGAAASAVGAVATGLCRVGALNNGPSPSGGTASTGSRTDGGGASGSW
jgi:hypothetical protein